MITMKPIEAEEVLEIFNKGRFEGDVEGYILSDGKGCLGYCLYRIDKDLARILAAEVQDEALLDGAIRSCLAAAQDRGAAGFWVEDSSEPVVRWKQKWCGGISAPIPFDRIFHTCCH